MAGESGRRIAARGEAVPLLLHFQFICAPNLPLRPSPRPSGVLTSSTGVRSGHKVQCTPHGAPAYSR
ncbi:uncharacterized protein TRAVEDRAFT_30963 [Trametes versicolor FP-101664 SS1]|uniref:uncharacterized protein n=1 Tax=Trametes versicolor (strain FP-101664) TaxID=717944 RepID=UPI0004621F17|nr:uncharacterized protein TRAVEDRAFT_30963 [Trametes versicolor FP-101664 SS1]EIW55075.1 hypothetical protein TRAVEDRAFT_30963 [Trametes versicolor FP-101664 SS1]